MQAADAEEFTVNAGRKQYSEAIGMLLHAITAPAMILSAITVAAVKKFILLCLIQKGNLQPFSTHESQIWLISRGEIDCPGLCFFNRNQQSCRRCRSQLCSELMELAGIS